MGSSLDIFTNSGSFVLKRGSLIGQVQDLRIRVDRLLDAVIDVDVLARKSGGLTRDIRVRRILKLRESRGKFFSDALFGEPAWDMLLELYAAHLEDREESVSNLFIGSKCPPTTGLRWVGVLDSHGWVERRTDENDARRVLVKLTPKGLTAMNNFFAQPEIQHGL